jgi:putative transposase
MSRNTILASGEFYHIYNRGTEKRDIFTSTTDYNRFVAQLYLCNSSTPVRIDNLTKQQGSTLLETLLEVDRGEPLVDIASYCLMSNHFHILVREKEEGGISRFMQKLLTGYTMYFNKRHERTGTLFQGKFKASHVTEDRYLKYLISYIHLNPVKIIDANWKENGIHNRKQAEFFLTKYPYSSYQDYLGYSRVENIIINPVVLPEYFESAGDFEASVTEWLNFKSETAL